MKQINIDFEKFEGSLDKFIANANDGDVYIVQMENTKNDNKIEIKIMEIHRCMTGNIAIINGRFHYDYNGCYNVIGICKVIC